MAQAAKTLGVNTSTVSRRLVALEEELDTTLFDRGRDGLRPTAAAHDLFPMAELVEQGVAQFAQVADQLEREISGVVRVACPPDAADVVVIPALRGLLHRHPGLCLALEPGEAVVDLNRREADIALRIVRPTRGDLWVKRVATVPFRAATAPELAQQLPSLDEVPWIGWHRPQRIPAAQWLDRRGIEPTIRTDSLTSQIAAARAGVGVALIPAQSVVHYGLVEVDVGVSDHDPLPTDDLFLVTHRALRNVPRIRAVWEAIVAHFEQQRS